MNEQEDASNNLEHLSPEGVQRAFDAAEQRAAEAQKAHNEAAQHAGYTREVIRSTAQFYVELAKLAEDSDPLKPVVSSGVNFVNTLGAELDQSAEGTLPTLRGLSGISHSASTFFSSTGTVSVSLFHKEIAAYDLPPSFLPDETSVEKKLSAIDPALADTYREVGQAYYGTTADPARAASTMMRQVFDHLFDKLAPDDVVRASPYWKRKQGLEPNQVTRRERITYSAHTHIHDEARADTIIANIDNILDAYQMLNKLHKRGALSKSQARSALKTLKDFIELWAEAIDE